MDQHPLSTVDIGQVHEGLPGGQPDRAERRDAITLFHAIRDWAESHYAEILSAREVYDERASREPQPVG